MAAGGSPAPSGPRRRRRPGAGGPLCPAHSLVPEVRRAPQAVGLNARAAVPRPSVPAPRARVVWRAAQRAGLRSVRAALTACPLALSRDPGRQVRSLTAFHCPLDTVPGRRRHRLCPARGLKASTGERKVSVRAARTPGSPSLRSPRVTGLRQRGGPGPAAERCARLRENAGGRVPGTRPLAGDHQSQGARPAVRLGPVRGPAPDQSSPIKSRWIGGFRPRPCRVPATANQKSRGGGAKACWMGRPGPAH